MLLVGTGGQAKVVLEALASNGFDKSAVIHSGRDAAQADAFFSAGQLVTPEFPEDMTIADFHVAIGSNADRQRLFNVGSDRGGVGVTVIHSKAIVSDISSVAAMTFIAAGAVVAAQAQIGTGAILNHNSVTDHDCVVGDFSHIAPGAVLGGNVSVGNNTLIGSGAVVLPEVTIGNNVTVGAGSVVTKPIEDNGVWIGNGLSQD